MTFILRISILLALTSFFASSSQAATLTGWSDHHFQAKDVITAKATIYVGSAGPDCGSTEAPCNTCTGLDLTTVNSYATCNNKSISSALKFAVTITTATDTNLFDNTPELKMFVNTTAVTMSGTQPTPSAGGTFVATTTWGAICQAMQGADGTCGTSFSGTLTIGVYENGANTTTEFVTITINYKKVVSSAADFPGPDSYHTICDPPASGTPINKEGVCGFSVFPGDQKVFINDILIPRGTSVWPAGTDTIEYWGARFYFAEIPEASTDYTGIVPGASATGSADIQISADASISPNRITGLSNDVNYGFIVGTLDNSGNVRHFTQVSRTMIAQHMAKPSEVFGMLDKQKCFVATAAYGSEIDTRINIFRNFRDQILMTNSLGRSFVNWYYKSGPRYAKIIAESDELRFLTRGALWPLLSFAQLSLTFGFILASIISALTLGALVFGIRKFRKAMN